MQQASSRGGGRMERRTLVLEPQVLIARLVALVPPARRHPVTAALGLTYACRPGCRA